MSDMPLATALKEIRAGLDLSQPAFAAHVTDLGMKLSKGTVGPLETGARTPSEEWVDEFATALDLRPAQRKQLQEARRLQVAVSLETATATRLAAFEQRLAELEAWRASVEVELTTNAQFATAADTGKAARKGRTRRGPSPEPEPEGP